MVEKLDQGYIADKLQESRVPGVPMSDSKKQ